LFGYRHFFVPVPAGADRLVVLIMLVSRLPSRSGYRLLSGSRSASLVTSNAAVTVTSIYGKRTVVELSDVRDKFAGKG